MEEEVREEDEEGRLLSWLKWLHPTHQPHISLYLIISAISLADHNFHILTSSSALEDSFLILCLSSSTALSCPFFLAII
jgi:hypothetical protein